MRIRADRDPDPQHWSLFWGSFRDFISNPHLKFCAPLPRCDVCVAEWARRVWWSACPRLPTSSTRASTSSSSPPSPAGSPSNSSKGSVILLYTCKVYTRLFYTVHINCVPGTHFLNYIFYTGIIFHIIIFSIFTLIFFIQYFFYTHIFHTTYFSYCLASIQCWGAEIIYFRLWLRLHPCPLFWLRLNLRLQPQAPAIYCHLKLFYTSKYHTNGGRN